MKAILFGLFLTTLPQWSSAQCYQSYKQEGDRLNREAIYEKAIKYYLAAFTCPGLEQEERDELIRLIDRALQARVRQLQAANKKTQKALARAMKAEQEARQSEQNAKQSLADLQDALDERDQAEQEAKIALSTISTIVNNLLQSAEEDILNLNYEGALDKIKDAVSLKVDEEKVGLGLMELVYFFNEIGRYERAISLSDTLNTLLKIGKLSSQQHSLAGIRAYLSTARPARYQQLEARYYPAMVDIPGGIFEMGCNAKIYEDCRDDETPHQVQLGSYQLAKCETTNWQYNLYCLSTGQARIGRNRAGWFLPGNLPVVNVHWYDAIQYLNWLNVQQGLARAYVIDKEKKDISNTNWSDTLRWTVQLASKGEGYRLPTEAEWEYAAQGGVSKKAAIYSGSNDLTKVGWYRSNSNSRPQPVGTLQANRLGLYDLSGNVLEWCWDWHLGYYEDKVKNPLGPSTGRSRVLRGGSWYNVGYFCRVSNRNFSSIPGLRWVINPGLRRSSVGFRVAQGL